jgi:hypothetical protein
MSRARSQGPPGPIDCSMSMRHEIYTREPIYPLFVTRPRLSQQRSRLRPTPPARGRTSACVPRASGHSTTWEDQNSPWFRPRSTLLVPMTAKPDIVANGCYPLLSKNEQTCAVLEKKRVGASLLSGLLVVAVPVSVNECFGCSGRSGLRGLRILHIKDLLI